tara:strand:+ start:2254 stop:2703 length:450 start_codon:yes stop_codon:yes gene_type:complete
MSKNEKVNLKLIGKNKEDLQVISAYIQDSVTTVKDIVYLKKNRSFVMIVNRFMWEDIERGVFRENKRIRCAIKFEEVLKVKSKNINQKNKNKILECLAINQKLVFDNLFKLDIVFAGDSLITIISEAIEVVMHDLGDPWNVKHVPRHKI